MDKYTKARHAHAADPSKSPPAPRRRMEGVKGKTSGQEPSSKKAEIQLEKTALLFACKDESFSLRSDFKVLSRTLKEMFGLVVLQLSEEIGEEAMLPRCSMIILAGLRKPLLPRELDLLTDYIEGGGRVIVLAEASSNAGIYNEFTQKFGITVMKDSLVRIDRYQQYHPLECFIKNAMICPTLMEQSDEGEPQNMNILYAKGCTLEVSKDALPLVSSGLSCYPGGRPLGAIYMNHKSNGKLVVLGSARLFTDEYIEKEENMKAVSFVIELLTEPGELSLEPMHIDDFHLKEYDVVHETANKSTFYRTCMQDTDEFIFPGSANTMGIIQPKKLVSSDLCKADYTLLPEVLESYKVLNLESKRLSKFVAPQMELALPSLKLALFPPKFRDLPKPPLELFDLSEEFSTPETMLGRIVNKCSEDDLEYCIEALGSIFEVTEKVEQTGTGLDRHKAILHYIASQLASAKHSFSSEPPTLPEVWEEDDDDSMKSSLNDPVMRPVPFAHNNSTSSRCN